jgi:hypothetical protein
MICQHCGCFFCYDDADSQRENDMPRLYCSKTCKDGAKKRRKAARQSPIERNLRRSCPRKIRYSTPGDAYVALGWLRDTGHAGPEAGIYQCPGCDNGWHITSKADWLTPLTA